MSGVPGTIWKAPYLETRSRAWDWGRRGQHKDGMGKGRDREEVKPELYSRHRAQGCICKGGWWQSQEAWGSRHSPVSPRGWWAGRLEADTGSGIQNGLSPDTEEGLWERTAGSVLPLPLPYRQ